MISLLALVILSVLAHAATVSFILYVYANVSLREAWSWTWEHPWFPIIMTIASLLAAAT